MRWLFITVGVVLAIVVDFYLMRWLRTRLQKRTSSIPLDGVYIWGAYSPVLTWLRKLWNTLPKTDGVNQDLNLQRELHTCSTKFSLIKIISWLSQRNEGFYIAVLAVGVLFYCRGILSLRLDLRLPGNESENFQYVLQLFRQSIVQDRHFPIWNPYLHTGLPYLGDPMLHIYNPFITIPCLLLGVRIGYRIALVLSYLLAAVGAMKLGIAFGFGSIVSLWLGLMFAFAGQPTARFFQGQYLFIFGFAWIPWVFYFLVRYWQTRDFKKLVYFAFAFALLYFSGNAYYTFLIFWLILIFIVLFMLRISSRPFQLSTDKRFFVSIFLALILWTGVVAIHFLPLIEFRPYMSKGQDIQGSHTPIHIWLDYTSKDTYRDDAYSLLPAREEFYAYIGYMPFIAITLLPFGWQKRRRAWILYWVMALGFVVVWIDVDRMPWRDFIYQTEFFSQFRHVLRALIFGHLAVFILGGFGIDAALTRSLAWLEAGREEYPSRLKRLLGGSGIVTLGFIMAWGIWDTFKTNRQYILLQEDDLPAYQVVRWLRDYDTSEYYVRRAPVNSWYLAMLTSRMRFIDAWYHWTDIRRIDAPDQLNRRPVQARPHYVIQSIDEPLPEQRYRLIQQFDGTVIYELLNSLPIAFKTQEQKLLANSNEELKKGEVEPLTPLFIKTNAIEVIAQGNQEDVLVVLVTNYPGWRVKVDDRNAKLENVSGYLAVKMQEGIHKYRFEFRPTVFYWGLLISLLSFGIGLYIIRSDMMVWAGRVKSFLCRFRELLERIKNRTVKGEKTEPSLPSAVFQQGTFVLNNSLALEEGREVDLVVLPKEKDRIHPPVFWAAWRQISWLLIRAYLGMLSFPSILFTFALLIYLGTRTVRLADFPIYFFTDEAIQTASAAELVRDGFYGPGKVFLPTYFPNGSYWNLSVSVYAQVVPYLLFGKSVFITRFTSLLLSAIMVLVLVNALRRTICPRAWWSLLLFLSVTPTWFLHSRTAFETVLFSGFYAAFLGAYLLYLQRSPRYLYFAIFMAALAFYTYSPGQMIIAVTAIALFALDFRYHWQNRTYLGKGLFLVALFTVPYVRFLSYHQEAPLQHLRNLDSYWFYDLPLTAKIGRYAKEYLMGLNPYYWFAPHSIDLNRHTMKGYGHLGLWNLPFIGLGLLFALRQWKNPPYRIFLVALLAVPSGAALVGIGITRLLAMVIPMAVLAVFGWEWVISAVQTDRWQKLAQIGLFVVLASLSLSMTVNSLRNGSTWYEDYGLYGMQYGTRQIFEQKIPQYLQREPQAHLFVSSLWANGADVFVRYFLTPEQARRVNLGSIDTYLSRKQPLDENVVFFLTAEEFCAALASPKMRLIKIEDQIPYPNGKTGFYIVRLAYMDNADELFARELELRRQLMTADIVVEGIPAQVRYSQIDDGELGNLFDQKPETLMRGREANPFILEFEFAQPQTFRGFQAQFGSMDFEMIVYLYAEEQIEPVVLQQSYQGLPPDPSIEFLWPQEMSLSKLKIEIRDLDHGEIANIHIREIKFLK